MSYIWIDFYKSKHFDTSLIVCFVISLQKIHGNLLLANLQGEKAKRNKILEKSITSLTEKREEFRREKKTGASLATEALGFYNVVVEMNQTWKGNSKGISPTRKTAGAKKMETIKIIEEVEVEEKAELLEEEGTPHETKTPSKDDESPNDLDRLKGKRQRRQPVLFDPQTCAASAWVGVGGGGSAIRTHEKSPKQPQCHATSSDPLGWVTEKDPKVLQRLHSFIEDKREEYSYAKNTECKYCMGEEDIVACCFCACRICFVKCDRDQTILCDICNADFHTYCLVPPLDPIPSGEWYCPTCISSIKTVLDEKIVTQRKERRISAPSVPEVKDASPSPEIIGVPVKRGPGRPRKHDKMPIVATRPKRKRSEDNIAPSNKKPRTDGKAEAAHPVPVLQSPAKSTIGKPSSSNNDETDLQLNMDDTILLDSTHRSRSGRLLKRNNFYNHNQGKEKEQHLKTSSRLNSDDGDNAFDEILPLSSPKGTQQSQRMISAGGLKESDSSLLSEKLSMDMNTVDESIQGVVSSGLYKSGTVKGSSTLDKDVASNQMDSSLTMEIVDSKESVARATSKGPRRKPGARECMQISRRFGVNVIPQKYMDILTDYCNRGKVEHLLRMRERLDEHSSFLELQLAGFEALVQEMNPPEPVTKVDDQVTLKTDHQDP